MADPTQLTKRERQIMDVVYAHNQATISQILAGLPDPPMRGALRNLLRILVRKGYLTRKEEGQEVLYRPTQARGRAGKSALGRVLDVFFNGSLEKAVAAHLSDSGRAEKPTAHELGRLAELIEEAKRKGV